SRLFWFPNVTMPVTRKDCGGALGVMIFTTWPTDQCCEFMVPRSMTTSSGPDGAVPATRRNDESERSGIQLTPRRGGPFLVRAFPLDLMRVTGPWMIGSASCTPGTLLTAGTTESGTGGRF